MSRRVRIAIIIIAIAAAGCIAYGVWISNHLS